MNRLSPDVLTTTTPLTNEQRLALWKIKRDQQSTVSPGARLGRPTPSTLPSAAMVQARSFLPFL